MNDHHHQACDKHDRQILTVGQLRDMIAGFDDDVHVVIDNDSMRGTSVGWYTNIGYVDLPDDDIFIAVTLYGGAECDSNQW